MQFWILDPEWIYRKSAFSLLYTMSVCGWLLHCYDYSPNSKAYVLEHFGDFWLFIFLANLILKENKQSPWCKRVADLLVSLGKHLTLVKRKWYFWKFITKNFYFEKNRYSSLPGHVINFSQYQKQLFRQYLIILNICSGWQLLQKAEHETMTYKSEQ